MAVFKTGSGRGKQRLDKFRFLEFGEKPKGIATDVLVGML
jgi:hypothetical protein